MFALDVPEHLDHFQRRKSAIFVPGNKTEQNLYYLKDTFRGRIQTFYEESVVDKFKSNLLLMIFWLNIINYNS